MVFYHRQSLGQGQGALTPVSPDPREKVGESIVVDMAALMRWIIILNAAASDIQSRSSRGGTARVPKGKFKNLTMMHSFAASIFVHCAAAASSTRSKGRVGGEPTGGSFALFGLALCLLVR